MPPTLHHWTSVPPRGPSGPHPQTKFKFTCVPKANQRILGSCKTPQKSIMSTDRGPFGLEHYFAGWRGLPEELRLEKRAPDDADDAGPLGQHHQNDWGSVAPIWRYQATAILIFLHFYDGFWLAPGGVKLKRTTSGPNPWFWAQNHVVIVGCKPIPKQQ